MKKQPFLLLEILIGVFLISLIAFPLLTRPISIYRAEMKAMEALERERLADLTFAEIKEKLLANQIPWEKLPKAGEKKKFSLAPLTIYLPAKKPLQRSFELECDLHQEREGEEGIYRFLKIAIYFDPPLEKGKKEDYSYSLFVQQLNN